MVDWSQSLLSAVISYQQDRRISIPTFKPGSFLRGGGSGEGGDGRKRKRKSGKSGEISLVFRTYSK